MTFNYGKKAAVWHDLNCIDDCSTSAYGYKKTVEHLLKRKVKHCQTQWITDKLLVYK